MLLFVFWGGGGVFFLAIFLAVVMDISLPLFFLQNKSKKLNVHVINLGDCISTCA